MGSLPEGLSAQGGVSAWGVCLGGLPRHPPSRHPRYGQPVGSMHPTGMHPDFSYDI